MCPAGHFLWRSPREFGILPRASTRKERSERGDGGAGLGGEALDVLAVEETLVDFISHEFPISLRTAGKFIRYLCGQPANVAVYVTKLGGRSGMISKVGTDHFGEYLEEQLARTSVSAEGLEGLSRTGDAATTNVFVTETVGVPDFQVNRGTDVLLSICEVTDELVERARIVHASAPRPSPSRVTRSGWRPDRPCD
jgi:fructokinase